MSLNIVILLLGSNLGDKKNNLQVAKTCINRNIGEILAESEIIQTKPEDFDSVNQFLNQTLKIKTTLSPIQLLEGIKKIENEMGRVYLPVSQKYQDRIIDIDILTFNQIKFYSKTLIIPHHQIESRKFVKNIPNYRLEK